MNPSILSGSPFGNVDRGHEWDQCQKMSAYFIRYFFLACDNLMKLRRKKLRNYNF